ncbi:MAG: alpha/beta fold hydrolase [Pseudomonadales bacterium]|nr:alpha/beta fold hydrolase [Pseudomonadales bacterium]
MVLVPRSILLRGSLIAVFVLSIAAIVTNQLFAQAQDSTRISTDVGPALSLGNVEYVEVNTGTEDGSAKQLIVFVHGTPGSFTAFLRYMNDPQMRENFHMISVTRPGWTERDAEKVSSLDVQAAALEPFLRMDASGKGAILMGHSYGGPVITKTAMLYQELVSGLVFVATTGDPELSGPRWYNRFAVVIPRFILGNSLKGANAEIMPLRPQLEAILPQWEELEMPVLIVQGDRDRLVHPHNAEFMQRMLVNADVTYMWREGQGHFVLWEEAELIVESIVEKFNPSN